MQIECLQSLQIRRPLKALRSDLDLVRRGRPALHTTADMLRLFHLDGEKQDGKTIGDRLMVENICDRIIPTSKNDLNTARLAIGHIDILITKLGKHTENEYELELARTLATLAERQILREEKICSLASDMYLSIARNRPDLVDQSVVQRIYQPPMESVIFALISKAMNGKVPSGAIEFIGFVDSEETRRRLRNRR
ncbi:MAG: hypothetical protein WCT22_02790 [Patescibacteria group bacterium]|jgi:hypothetical protein